MTKQNKKLKTKDSKKNLRKILIEADEVEKVYKTSSEKINVLKKVNLVIRESDYVSIIGLKGSGKTTLLNCLFCIEKVDGGKIYINEESVDNLSDKELTDLRASFFSFITDATELFNTLSAKENILLAANKNRSIDFEYYCKLLFLDEKKLGDYPQKLTRLEKIKVELFQTIVNEPELLLLDHLEAGLEEKDKEEYGALLFRLNKEKNIALVCTTDDISSGMKANKVYRLSNGRLS